MQTHFARFTRFYRSLLVTALLAIFAAQLIHVARSYSMSWDEGHHLYDGYTIWKQGDYRLNAEVPPLVKLTAALPLLGMHLYVPARQGRSQGEEAFLGGRAFVFQNGADRVLFPARMACMGFTLVLALLLYFTTREMFGAAAALVALALFVFDPNFLAHGTLVTTDAGSALFFLAAVFAFYRYCKSPTWLRLFLVGLATGLAFVAKFSGVFLVLILLLLAASEALLGRSLQLLWKRLAACAAVFFFGWFLVWSFYGFRYAAAPAGRQLDPPLGKYLQTMPNGENGRELELVARYKLLPEGYIWGLANTKKTEWEDPSYFLGRIYRHGSWRYFPYALLIKSTLPLLFLLCLLPVACRWSPSFRRREAFFCFIPVVVYFAIVMHYSMDIGLRHLLPVYPFLYVLAAGGAAAALQRNAYWKTLISLLLVWQAVTSLRSSPGYMAYGNEAWGGPSQVHRYLSDANVDWGQQLKDVRAYLDQRHITHCWFAYFPDGAVEPSDYGIPCKRLPTTNTLWWLNLPMQVPPVIDGTVLISDSDLEGIEFGDGPLNPYDAFRGIEPVAVIQDGVDVYQGRFAIPLASALVDARSAAALQKSGNLAAALDLARSAAARAPGSVQVQLALGDALVANRQKDEALAHYRAALHLAQTIRPSLQADLIPQIDAAIASLGKRE